MATKKKIEDLPEPVLVGKVKMHAPGVRREAAGITVGDGEDVIYTADASGVIEAEREHVAALRAIGWAVIE
jgi:hypothetical protein